MMMQEQTLLAEYKSIGTVAECREAMNAWRKTRMSVTAMPDDVLATILDKMADCKTLLNFCSTNKSLCDTQWERLYKARFEESVSTSHWRALFAMRCALRIHIEQLLENEIPNGAPKKKTRIASNGLVQFINTYLRPDSLRWYRIEP